MDAGGGFYHHDTCDLMLGFFHIYDVPVEMHFGTRGRVKVCALLMMMLFMPSDYRCRKSLQYRNVGRRSSTQVNEGRKRSTIL